MTHWLEFPLLSSLPLSNTSNSSSPKKAATTGYIAISQIPPNKRSINILTTSLSAPMSVGRQLGRSVIISQKGAKLQFHVPTATLVIFLGLFPFVQLFNQNPKASSVNFDHTLFTIILKYNLHCPSARTSVITVVLGLALLCILVSSVVALA